MATVAPKERVNITYQPATGNVDGGVELPLKILMIGDYTQRPDDTPVEDRKAISVTKRNFEDVLREQKLQVTINVPDKISGSEGDIPMTLKFSSLKDFGPEGIVSQVPELNKLIELRTALSALKGPLGNFPKFKKRIQELLSDEKQRAALMKELGIDPTKT